MEDEPTSYVAKSGLAVEVKVTDPQADPTKGFYTYLVSGSDPLGTFEIRRRYNDFYYLREALVKKWPGIYIPPVPEKKITGNKDAENIEVRKKFFDFFLKRLARIPHLFKSPITQEFLRNKGIEMEKFYTTLQAPRYGDLLVEYRDTYTNLDFAQENTNEIKANIANFGGFLKKAEKELEGLRSQVEIIVEARNGFTQHLNNCNTSMLPEYERNVYAEYLPEEEKKDPHLIFVNNHKVQDNIRNLRDVAAVNSFSASLDLITYEILEVKAMEEALRIKEKYEADKKESDELLLKNQSELAKLMGGKTTLKSIFSRGSKNEQIQKLEKDIPDLEKQIKSLGEFNHTLTIIFGLQEMPIFKRQKQLQYYQMMYEVSENELRYLATYGEFMKSIMQGLKK